MKTERVWINDQYILFTTNVTFRNSVQYTYIPVCTFQHSSTEMKGSVIRFNEEDMHCTYFSLQCRLLHVNGKNENFTIDSCHILINVRHN